jgi:hypothetical protein
MNLNQKQYTDFYADEEDSAIRGVLLYQNIPQLIAERTSDEVRIDTPVSKWCSRFPRNVQAPQKPTDPLYVFSKWSMVCKADSVAEIANMLLDGIEAVFTRKCEVSTNLSKCKISITSPCGLSIKVKFFAVPEDPCTFMVMFRKDYGDWFAFSSFYNSCVKFVANKGISFTTTQ